MSNVAECTAPQTLERPATADSPARPYSAPNRQIWGWAVGRVSEFGLIGTYGQAMNIFTVGFGLSPVIVSWCMMLPRVLDGILDPIIGHWSDNLHTRWGRRKPFLIGGALIGAVFLAVLWWASPAWSPTTQFLYLGIIGTCLYLCYGVFAMAWNAVGFELSDDYHERSRVAAIGGFFLAAMILQNGWMYWLALRPAFGNVIWGMRWIGGAMAVLVVVCAIICARSIHERFTHTNRGHVKLLPAVRTALKNRAFVYLLLMKVCEIFGGRLTGGVSFFLGVYYVCRGDQDLATRIAGIGATLGMVWNFAMLPLVKPASKLIGKRGALITSTAIGFATALVAPFITTPEHPYWQLIPGLIVAPLLVITGTIAGAVLPDICDVDELQTGSRREGLFTSVMGFVGKLEISLAVVLVGYLVSWASLDTKIGLRWASLIDGKTEPVAGFAVGESAVFTAEAARPITADTLRVVGNVGEVELSVSDTSPTQDFRPVGRFTTGAPAAGSSFPPVTARYFKVHLLTGGDGGGTLTLQELSLTAGDSPENAVAAKVLAARPPDRVVSRLYWLVMIPGIVFSGLTLLMTILFPLTESVMLEIRRKLDEVRLANAAAGVPTDEIVEERLAHGEGDKSP